MAIVEARFYLYVADIIDGIRSSIKKNHSCEVFNLGNNKSEKASWM